MRQHTRLVYVSIALCSFSALLMELTQTRILSFVFWNHAVYLTVALALLGFGISGTIVALLAARGEVFSPRILTRLWCGFGLSMFGAVAVTAWILPRLGQSHWVQLAACYVLYVIPFVCAGAILSILFASAGEKMGNLYAVDLTAAGLGCVLFFVLLPLLGAAQLVCLLSALALAMGYSWSGVGDRVWRWLAVGGAPTLLLLFGWLQVNPSLLDFPTEPQKELGVITSHPDYAAARIETTTWTPITRIDIIGDPTSNLLGYQHPKGSYKIITQDGTAHTRLPSEEAIRYETDRIHAVGDRHPTNMAYEVRPDPDVAIIGVGGGIDVAFALAHGARSVFGIELNPATYRYVTQDYADYTGRLMDDPRVTFVNAEGRSTLRGTDRRFDIVQVIGIDTFAALSTGAYVLSENYLYTVEAFQDMFGRLKEDGILSFYRWLFHPPRETLRVSSLACEAWRQSGVPDCDTRIMVIGAGGWGLSLFKNSPFTAAEVDTLARHAGQLDHYVLYWPPIHAPSQQAAVEENYYAAVPPEIRDTAAAFKGLIHAYAGGTEPEFLGGYQYNVAATTDDSPFFFEYHFLNAIGLPHLWALRGDENANRTLYIILVQATVFSLFAILLPLYKFQRSGLRVPGAAQYSLYFAGLGFGFMVIEIGITQKSVLFLGSPLYSLSVVLATLLLSAGIGGRLLARLGWTLKKTTMVVGLIFLATMVLIMVGLTPLFQALLHWPFPLRILTVILVLAPLGILMGFFFPAGLQSIGNRASTFVPWAWGINGCTSVYGSIVAILIAMAAGFGTTLAVGTIVYALSFLAAHALPTERVQRAQQDARLLASRPAS